MNSRCSRCALFTKATVGWASAASAAISPGWFMPNSTTAMRWCARRRNNVSGTPMSLFKLPCVARLASPGAWACRMDAIICVTVVLPLLPVTAISGRSNCARQARASWPSAALVSGTSMRGRSAGSCAAAKPLRQMTATAPLACASCNMALASNVSPCNAINRSPLAMLRVSVCTRAIGVSASPSTACGWLAASPLWASHCATWPRVISGVLMRGPPGGGHAPAAPAMRDRGLKTQF